MIERKLENRGLAPGPAGSDRGPDYPAGRRAISAWRRTGIQNTSSVGPPKRSGRPPGGPAPGLAAAGQPAEMAS
jgi:hypothetical protein